MMENNLTIEPVDISLTLTFEELIVLLDILEVEALAGLDRDVRNQATQEQLSLIDSTARRGLTARQYISYEEDGWKIEPVILTILTTCVVPATTTIIVSNHPSTGNGRNQVHYLHTAESIVVAHLPQENGFHQFIWRRSPNPLVESALYVLDLKTNGAIDSPAVIVSEDLMTEARDAAVQDEVKAQTVLQQAHVPQETAVSLAHSMATAQTFATLAHIRHNQDNAQDGFTILIAENGLWLIKPVTDNQIKEPVSVEPISRLEAEQMVADLLKVNGSVSG